MAKVIFFGQKMLTYNQVLTLRKLGNKVRRLYWPLEERKRQASISGYKFGFVINKLLNK